MKKLLLTISILSILYHISTYFGDSDNLASVSSVSINNMIVNTKNNSYISKNSVASLKEISRNLVKNRECTNEEISFGWTPSTKRNTYFIYCEQSGYSKKIYYNPVTEVRS